MLIYLVVFIFSTLFYKLSQSYQNRFLRLLLILIAILIPSLIAAYRDGSVGRDFFGTYGLYVWDSCCKAIKFSDIRAFALDDVDYFYIIFNYLISRFTSDYHYFFFFHELFIVTFIIFVCEGLRKKIDSWIFYGLFLLYLYNDSFNMLRQIMAVSLGAYSTYLLIQGRILRSYVIIVFAFLFHPSAFLLITQYPLMLLIDLFGKKKMFLTFALCVSFVLLIFSSQFIIKTFVGFGLLVSRYTQYFGSSDYKSNKFDLMYLACMLVFIYSMTSKLFRNRKLYYYAIIFIVISFLLTLMGSMIEVASRAAFYYILPTFFILPLCTHKKSDKQKILYLLLLFLFVRFLYIASGGNWSDTIPYRSKILGIT